MRFMTPERDWERLGRTFAAARKAADMSQVEAAEQLHVSRTAVQAIERGRQSNGTPFIRISATMRAYARLLGWTEDSPLLIAEGGTPQTAGSADGVPAGPKSNLPMAVERELRSGTTLDHAVVDLGSGEDEGVRLIVVLQGGEDMSDEEIDEAWAKWRRTRRQLQAIPGESDTPQET